MAGDALAVVGVNFWVTRERGPARHRLQPALLRLPVEVGVHDVDVRGGHQHVPTLARGHPGGDVSVKEPLLELHVWPRKVCGVLVLDDEALEVLLVLPEARCTANGLGARVPRVMKPRARVVAALSRWVVATYGLVFGLHVALELEESGRARPRLDEYVDGGDELLVQPDADAAVLLHGLDECDAFRVVLVVGGDRVERDNLRPALLGFRDLHPVCRVGASRF